MKLICKPCDTSWEQDDSDTDPFVYCPMCGVKFATSL